MAPRRTARRPPRARALDVSPFPGAPELERPGTPYRRNEAIFEQDDLGRDVFYVQTGGVRLSVRSKTDREAVVATLGPGDFFGEACLAGQAVRTGSATAITPSVILRIGTRSMARLLCRRRAISDRFVAHVLSRYMRIERDLLDRLFASSETRLARVLLGMARYGRRGAPSRRVPPVSQGTLAEMAGTTRAHVKTLLDKFKKLGFIDYRPAHPLTVHPSLLNVVLND